MRGPGRGGSWGFGTHSLFVRAKHRTSQPASSEALVAGLPWYNAQMMLRGLSFTRLCRIPLALLHLLQRAHGAVKRVSVVAA